MKKGRKFLKEDHPQFVPREEAERLEKMILRKFEKPGIKVKKQEPPEPGTFLIRLHPLRH